MEKILLRPRLVLKTPIITLPPNAPHHTQGNHFPNDRTPRTATRPPTSIKIFDCTRHNSAKTKSGEKSVPQSPRSPTMKKEMINRLFIRLTYPTSVYHHHPPPSKIVQGEDLTPSSRPCKKRHSRRSFVLQMLFQGKEMGPWAERIL